MSYHLKGFVRLILFFVFRPFVTYGAYGNPDTVWKSGWAGCLPLPLFGTIGFLKDNGKRSFYWSLLLVVLLAGMFALTPTVIRAQDATDVITEAPTEVGTPPSEVTPVPENPPQQLDPELIALIFNAVRDVVVGVGVAIAAGVAIPTIIVNFFAMRTVRNLGEKLFLSTPPDTQVQIHNGVRNAEQFAGKVFDFLKDVTDGIMGGTITPQSERRSPPNDPDSPSDLPF